LLRPPTQAGVSAWNREKAVSAPLRNYRERINVSAHTVLVMLLVGLVAGWLAGKIVRGSGFGVIGDIIVGILGAFIGDWLLRQLGIRLAAGIVGAILTAAIGGIVLLLIVGLLRGGGRWQGGGWGRRWGGWG
jgi:uncharacterized membrane protein YeaQ/YmgE (transglycosylase-associated protein family)